ncbi:Fic family protein [uncultured Lamprocystis sp.]|jgi:death-on-curing protein|uniref:type II toxin-antitoxin system death-on-curing family toxin n=1 Tax=uncultured Lamprocystis sp. TaxID=543132 RepID=UPI0025DB476F|nr:Fic family protein [uncultured Lamprocystis sp.]
MRYLSLAEVLELHRRLLATSGGAQGVRDLGAVESAVSGPHAAFAGEELYLDLVAKAAALCYSLVRNQRLNSFERDEDQALCELRDANFVP